MPSTRLAKRLWTKKEIDKQHQRDRQAGGLEEFLYRPDRSVPVPKDRRQDAKPDETDLRNVKVGIHIKLDADIIEFFKTRASEPNAAPYQTQINTALRGFVDSCGPQTEARLVDAVAGRLLHDPAVIESVRGKSRRRA